MYCIAWVSKLFVLHPIVSPFCINSILYYYSVYCLFLFGGGDGMGGDGEVGGGESDRDTSRSCSPVIVSSCS